MVAAVNAGRGVIVTGGLGGIGHATARRFAAEGASIMIVDIREDGGEGAEVLKQLGAANSLAIACDIADETAVAAAVDTALAHFGRLDVVVNVAGRMLYKPLAETAAADWRSVLDVNLVGAANFTSQALRHMSPGGAIVNVASVHAVQTSALVATYAAAKSALISLTRTTAIEGKAKSIRANAVLPGAIDTDMLWSNPNIASGAEVLADDDIGQPEDVAAAIAFLASHEARFINGASLLVDGGRLARL